MKKRVTRKEKLEALKRESERVDKERLERRLSLPMEKRTHFLRKRVGDRGSCL